MGSFGAHSDGCSCRYGPDSPCQSIHACAVHQSKTNPAITHRARFLLRTGQANRSELMWQLTSINSGAKVNEAGLRTRWEDVCTVPHRTMLGWACRPCQQQCIIQPVVMGDAYAHPPIPPPQLTQSRTDTRPQTHTQPRTHAQTLTATRRRAVYAHIKVKSLISVTARALAPEELANSWVTKAHPPQIRRVCIWGQRMSDI